ncbi:hypothetical protein Bca52824_072925 [Brassica carinata]|uniref:Uncharacterized protein n=1 Tax=Brassica carinata TaxID=52824 RepID=A0A8X7U670_BRACI|nr:hypothetical protein Bca52824_072925 [Brassica carinata]
MGRVAFKGADGLFVEQRNCWLLHHRWVYTSSSVRAYTAMPNWVLVLVVPERQSVSTDIAYEGSRGRRSMKAAILSRAAKKMRDNMAVDIWKELVDQHLKENVDGDKFVGITLKTLSLPGKLPPELVKLPYFQEIDLCRNCLSGSIPIEWASMPYLTLIAVCANNLSGPLPTGLQNFKNLKVLGVEANQFSGPIPDEIGNLTTLKRLNLASNQFTGSLPTTLAKLVNLQDFRISDNKFNGIIPSFIGDWPWLKKLHLYASGLKGPIPDALTRLENLTDMRISDMTGISSFPYISSKSMETLVLRNLSLSGQIPSYIWSMPVLKTL